VCESKQTTNFIVPNLRIRGKKVPMDPQFIPLLNASFLNLFKLFDTISAPEEASYDLLSYIAWSDTWQDDPDDNWRNCYADMYNRVDQLSKINIKPQEVTIFEKRLKIIRTKNKAYRIAVKPNPSVEDLEEFSYIEPCYSILWPLKCYLLDHPEKALTYKGCLPFGKPVQDYFNQCHPDQQIKGTPDYKDHTILKDWSNKLAMLCNIPSVTVNTLMHLGGFSGILGENKYRITKSRIKLP